MKKSFHIDAYFNDIKSMNKHLSEGFDINKRSDNGRTPLHIAVGNSHYDACCWFIEHGADVNAKDENGLTPLHLAVYKKNIPIIKALILAGADIHTKDCYGLTPLDSLCQDDKAREELEKLSQTGQVVRAAEKKTGDKCSYEWEI